MTRKELGGLAFLLGALLFFDDIDDFPKLNRLHHWLIGAGLGTVGIYLLSKN